MVQPKRQKRSGSNGLACAKEKATLLPLDDQLGGFPGLRDQCTTLRHVGFEESPARNLVLIRPGVRDNYRVYVTTKLYAYFLSIKIIMTFLNHFLMSVRRSHVCR